MARVSSKRHDGVAHATNAASVADGLVQRPSQRDAHVLDQVVPSGMQVALGLQGDIDEAVAGDLADHVVKKTVAGVHIVDARAVQVQ